MDNNKVLQYCDQIDVLVEQIRNEVAEPPVEFVTINAGEDLQAALNEGGAYQLANGADFGTSGGYKLVVSNTTLVGISENKLVGSRGPALRCDLEFQGAVIEDLQLGTTEYDDSIVRLGLNTSVQNDLLKVPRDISLTRISVPTYRGKRAIQINAADVIIEDCDIRDVYAPSKQDSQAILVLNSPGNIEVRNCYLESAGENMMVGGDAMKIPNCRPTNILVEDCQLTKPIAWKGNTAIPVKNLFELKDGHNVTLRHCELWNCWTSAQIGHAIVFTPTAGASLLNALIEDCNVHDVGGILNITGLEQHGNYPNEPRTQVRVKGGTYKTNKAQMGGRGQFAQIGCGPEYLIVEDAEIQIDGTSFILIWDDKPIDKLHIFNSSWNYGSYGIMINGRAHGDNSLGQIKDLKVEGCMIRGAHSAFRTRFPNNTYTDVLSANQEKKIDTREMDVDFDNGEESRIEF